MFNILNNTNLTAQTQTIFDGTGKLVFLGIAKEVTTCVS
jgi:hypothetical protein